MNRTPPLVVVAALAVILGLSGCSQDEKNAKRALADAKVISAELMQDIRVDGTRESLCYGAKKASFKDQLFGIDSGRTARATSGFTAEHLVATEAERFKYWQKITSRILSEGFIILPKGTTSVSDGEFEVYQKSKDRKATTVSLSAPSPTVWVQLTVEVPC